jgi:hypothetical protein
MIIGASSMKSSKYDTEDLKILDTAAQDLLARATWRQGFVRFYYPDYGRLGCNNVQSGR